MSKEKKKINWAIYWRLFEYVKPYKGRLILGLLCGFTAAFAILGGLGQIASLMESVSSKGESSKKADELIVENAGSQRKIAVKRTKNEQGAYEETLRIGDQVLSKVELSVDEAQRKAWDDKVNEVPESVRDFLTQTCKLELQDPETGEPKGLFMAMAAIFFLLFFLLKNAATYANRYIMRWIGFRVVTDIRNDLFKKLTNQSMEFHNSEDIGQMMSRCTQDANVIKNAISENIGRLTRGPVEIVAVCGFMVWFSIQNNLLELILILFVGMPLCLMPIFLLGGRLKKYAKKSMRRVALVLGQMQESLSCIRVVKAHNTEQYEQDLFNKTNDNFFKSLMKSMKYELMMAPLTEFASVVCIFALLAYCYVQGIGPEVIVPLVFAAQTAYKPLKDLIKVQANLIKSIAAAERIFDYMDLDYEIREKKEAISLNSFEKEIRFEGVDFSYAGQKTIDNVSLTIKKGEHVAFVGEAGSGKSTIVNMLARFYDIHSGSIKVDGVDVRDLSHKSLHDLIGFVDQVTTLFSKSVRYNIAYGLEGADEQAITDAAAKADVSGFIGDKEEGFDFEVGAKGVKLSGGQRQRVAIARALLKNPPILVLDEATSALDNITEQTVQKAINNLMGDRTVIAIAHRLSTVKEANCIYVMDQGRVVEFGTHDELLQKGGKYTTLWNAQFTENSDEV